MAKNNKLDKSVLLVEYQKAQDSAEHHDTLIWTVSSIIFAGFTALLGFIVNIFATIKFELITLVISIFGIILSFSLFIFIQNFRYYKNAGYYRCKQIEIKLGMEHHLLTDPLYDAEKHKFTDLPRKPSRPRIKQWLIMKILLISVSIVFVLIILNFLKIIQI